MKVSSSDDPGSLPLLLAGVAMEESKYPKRRSFKEKENKKGYKHRDGKTDFEIFRFPPAIADNLFSLTRTLLD